MPLARALSIRALLAAAVVIASLSACASPGPPSRVLRVGTSGDYAPFSTRDANGDLRGFDIDVAERFAADTGRTVAWVPFRWPDLMRSLEEKHFDVAMSGVTVRPERSVRGRFTLPVTETGAMLLAREAVVRASSGVESSGGDPLEALDRPSVRLAVNAGGHLERVTRARFRSAAIRAIAGNAEVREALVEAEVDAIVTDSLEAPHWLAGLEGVRALGPFTRDDKAYWVGAEASDLAAELDAWLIARERDGSLARIRARWFPEAARARTASALGALLAATDERLALMPSVAEFKRRAGREVVDPAREERVVEAGWKAVSKVAVARGVTPPGRDAVLAFYRAQIDAAVAIQRQVLGGTAPPDAPAFDLAKELRPALLRIGERMAWLLVEAHGSFLDPGRSGDSGDPGDFEARVARALSRHGLPQEHVAAIAEAAARIAFRPPDA